MLETRMGCCRQPRLDFSRSRTPRRRLARALLPRHLRTQLRTHPEVDFVEDFLVEDHERWAYCHEDRDDADSIRRHPAGLS